MRCCLHNKTGLKREPGSYIKHPNEGDCYKCSYDPENNKNCRKFYLINLVIAYVKKGPVAEAFTNDNAKWKKQVQDIINPRSSGE